jgi:hypothetical protein
MRVGPRRAGNLSRKRPRRAMDLSQRREWRGDPLSNFPASVSFTPYAFFRNISATPKTLHVVAYYMDGRTVKSLPLAWMGKQPRVEAVNLAFSYDGYWNDILAGIGSTDQTGTTSFQWRLRRQTGAGPERRAIGWSINPTVPWPSGRGINEREYEDA